MKRFLMIMIGVIGMLSGCIAPNAESIEVPIAPVAPVQQILLANQAAELVWLDQGLVMTTLTPPLTLPIVKDLRWVDATNPQGQPLPIALDPAFEQVYFADPHRLPDGRLQFLRYEFTPAIRGLPVRHFTLEVYDPETEAVSLLMPDPMPDPLTTLSLDIAWSPDMQQALATNGGQLKSKMYRWDAQAGLTPFDGGVAVCQMVAWSPDGQQIIFAGKPGTSVDVAVSLGMPHNLYIMNADGSDQRLLAEKIPFLTGMDWSPDGRWLAYAGKPVDATGLELWVINVATGERYQLTNGSPGDYTAPTWSPDGRQIAAIWQEMGHPIGRYFVNIIDVPTALLEP